jgi:hypothetical protein
MGQVQPSEVEVDVEASAQRSRSDSDGRTLRPGPLRWRGFLRFRKSQQNLKEEE